MGDVGSETFRADEAFDRNRGLIAPDEQRRLASRCVALAGCGGVGGLHAHTMARLGVGRYRLADPDTFSVANFNRQIGASMDTLGRPKARVTAEMVAAINPHAQVEAFDAALDPASLPGFLDGVDLVIDGIDFFQLPARRQLLHAAEARGIPVLIAGPLGFSATLHVFAPGGMCFDDFFDLRDGQDVVEQYANFLLGLAPAGLHATYTDISAADPTTGRGPSSIVGTQLAACAAGAEAVRILLDRGPSRVAPWFLQVDLYRRRMVSRRLRWGLRGPWQRVKRRLVMRYFQRHGLDRAFATLTAA